jgi:ssDNA-binding Zn-finger/Zn-ribbon topoisomerase 1
MQADGASKAMEEDPQPQQEEEEEDEMAVKCAACDQRQDALDNLSRKRFKINTACGHYL